MTAMLNHPPHGQAANLVYTGIGSRQTPPDVLADMQLIAGQLARVGWTVRSGGAEGADRAFGDAAAAAGGDVELFLPWPGFAGHRACTLERPSAAALELASQYHPAWSTLRPAARKLHARNCHEVLGADLRSPSRLVVCWTPDGSTTGHGRGAGGSGQALRVASSYGVPVVNLALERDRRRLLDELAGISRRAR